MDFRQLTIYFSALTMDFGVLMMDTYTQCLKYVFQLSRNRMGAAYSGTLVIQSWLR